MKIIQAILSAFWLLTLVHGAAYFGVVVNAAGAGGDHGGDKGAGGVLGEFTITIPAPPKIVSFPPDFIGTNNIFKTTPDVAPTWTDAAPIPIDTAANTGVTGNTAAITGAIDTPSAIIDTIRTSAVITDAVNTPIASETVDTWVITPVSAYVTICPGPTTFTQGVQTYTVIEATTLTITNCPCTISYPAPPTVASVPVQPIGTGLLTPSGGPVVITNYTSIPSANPPAISFNSTRTTFIAVTAPPPHATQPLITLIRIYSYHACLCKEKSWGMR
ncbi:hypothetical protein V500_11179 [Pseudogymnoascus sp. VKM F-4518 (FW-2643)]|nr:hypothetical protein V500_11179 [Pseudogymnoascus sp. VKM F-4518 (FW-2643)]